MTRQCRPDQSRPKRPPTWSRTDPHARRRRPSRPARILIIEDEPEERRALQLLLEADKREVRAAADGDEALVILDQFNPDLVVMDWRMPGLAGVGLCRHINARADAPSIIVVSSAREAFESAAEVVAALHKPVDPDELRAVIGVWLTENAR